MFEDEDLFPPDPEALAGEPPELDQLEGLCLHMTQAMSHFQCEEHWCFVCGMTSNFARDYPHWDTFHGVTSHFARDYPHWDTFCKWHKEHLNSQGAGPDTKGCPPKGPITEVVVWVVTTCCSSSFYNNGPTAHWIGPETLVDIVVEGREAIALADSGNQVNVMTSTYVKCDEFPILLLEELVDHPVNLMGLGGGHTSPLGFVILRVCVVEVAGYDDVVFLIVPDKSEFSRCVPLVLGTCTLCRIINVIRESEIDRLSVRWTTTRTLHLLSRHGTADLGEGAVGVEEAQTPSAESTDKGIDEPILVKEHVKLGPFQTQILECKVKPLLGETMLMIVCPVRVGKTQLAGKHPLHPGLHVLHTLTRLEMGSGKVSVMLHNMSDSPIYLKKGMRIAGVESMVPVPHAELSPEVQAALGE